MNPITNRAPSHADVQNTIKSIVYSQSKDDNLKKRLKLSPEQLMGLIPLRAA